MRPRRNFKKMYRYDIECKNLMKHPVTIDCNIAPETDHGHGVLWRCHTHEFHGYPSTKEARAEAVQNIRVLISEYLKQLKNLQAIPTLRAENKKVKNSEVRAGFFVKTPSTRSHEPH